MDLKFLPRSLFESRIRPAASSSQVGTLCELRSSESLGKNRNAAARAFGLSVIDREVGNFPLNCKAVHLTHCSIPSKSFKMSWPAVFKSPEAQDPSNIRWMGDRQSEEGYRMVSLTGDGWGDASTNNG